MDDIRTLMEEVELRIKETKQETYEFKRDIILGASVLAEGVGGGRLGGGERAAVDHKADWLLASGSR